MVDPGRKKKSPKFSLNGWNLGEWFKGNAKTVKELAKVLLPLFITWAQTNNPALVVVFTVLGKLVIDSAEYFIKEY